MPKMVPTKLFGLLIRSSSGEAVYPEEFKEIFVAQRDRVLKDLKDGKKIVNVGSIDWEVFEIKGEGKDFVLFIPLSREFSHLYSMIIHELKNPLAAIRSMAQVIESSIKEGEDDRGKLLEFSALIIEEIDRMNRILSSIMKLAKPQTRFSYQFDIVEEVKKAMKTWREELKTKDIDIVLISNREKMLFLGNPDEIHQIVSNLLRNSKEALEGVENPKIVVNLWEGPKEIILSVKDNGKGMNKEVLRKVQISFYSSKPQGLGLGLFVVRSIVNRYNGSVIINSESGKGTEVVIRFPKK